jgi:hypothetical protein
VIDVREFRALLGATAVGKSDAEVLEMRDDAYAFMRVVLELGKRTNFKVPIEPRPLDQDRMARV